MRECCRSSEWREQEESRGMHSWRKNSACVYIAWSHEKRCGGVETVGFEGERERGVRYLGREKGNLKWSERVWNNYYALDAICWKGMCV